MSNWRLQDILVLPVLLLALTFAVGTIVVGVTFHMPKELTLDAKILKAVGGGAFWQRCGTNCWQIVEANNQPAQILSVSGTTVLLIYPKLSKVDQRVITDVAGRGAWKWMTSLYGPLYADAHGNAGSSRSVATFGDVQLTVGFNTNLGRTEVQFS